MRQVQFNIILIFLLAACSSTRIPVAAPTAIPFPTMTPGSSIVGLLPTPLPEEANLLSNPATAVAIASLPTATPDYSWCPVIDETLTLTGYIEQGRTIPTGTAAFLSDGGSPVVLESGLATAGLLGETGNVRVNLDLTGEGTPDVIVTYNDPEQGGILLVLTCENGGYVLRHQDVTGGEIPEILGVQDMNFNQVVELLYTSQDCSEVDGICQYRTDIISWDARRGTFARLLNTPPDGDVAPALGDLDNDNVIEVITRQEGTGTTESGPIRTGSQIYDWNGDSYVLSMSQPDPLRYVIQVVYEADRAFREERMDDAARLYLQALQNDSLGYWFGGNEADILRSYILYRILLVFTFAENGDPLNAYEQARNAFPNFEEAPVYTVMTEGFWQAYQTSNNLNTGCAAVLDIVEQVPQALELLNRYGTRSPSYTAQSLCPF